MPQEQPPEPLSPHTFDDVEDSPPAYNRNTLVSPLSNEGNLGSSIPSPDANRKNMGTNSLNQFTHNETTNSNPSLAQTSQEIHVESEDNDNSATAHGAENLTSDGNGYTPAETSHGDPNLDENLATNAVDTVNQGKSNDMDSPSASLGSSVDYEDDTDGGSDNLDEGDEATYDVTKAWSSGITTGHRPRLTLDTGDIWTSGLWASNVNTVVTARASQVASHWPSQNLPDAENTLGGGETTDGDTDSTTNLASLAQNDAVNPGTTTETDNRGHGPKSSGESDPSHLNSLPQTGGVSNSGSTSDVQQEQDNPAGGEFAEENNASEMVGNGRSAARSGGMPDGGTEETPKNSEGQTDPIITTLTSDPNGDRSAEEKNDEFSGSPYEGQEAESLQTGVLERSMPSAGESDSEESLTPFDPLGRSTVVSRSSNDPFGTDTFENAQLNMPTNTCGDGSPVVSASQSHQSDLDASDIGHEVEEITANADFGDATTHSGMANVGAEVDDDSDDNSEGNNDLTEDSSFSYDESSSINENRSGHQSSWARMLPRFTVPGGFIGDDL
ncbi:hypothetical protein BD410DRAFT_843543 [Rickenella mellea]|uniref:Uncharacterized protein n=1 Tax=Rickenella mellea TaxID=50990 RepID=A0A4Y7PQ52_9AGAM|nr:hypothetical protein BD410DRAFT_843543 [Rickenella mellea]